MIVRKLRDTLAGIEIGSRMQLNPTCFGHTWAIFKKAYRCN
jgi:hypothetical protein